MISLLRGKVIAVDTTGAVVDVGGVGYRVLCPAGALGAMPTPGSSVVIHTHLHVREDQMTLYGFQTTEERDVFEILIGVNGIGPKGALAILSSYSPEALRKAVIAEDLDALTLIPGVGKKTAARMVLELKEKLGGGTFDAAPGGIASPSLAEARDALVSLGYSTTEAREAIEAIDAAGLGVEQILKLALKYLGAR